MPIYAAIQHLKSLAPTTEEGTQQFLDTLSPKVQEQLIYAIYLAANHLHETSLRPDAVLSRSVTDHIDHAEYASVLYKKGGSAIRYLDKIVQCAWVSKFDLNSL